MTERGPLVLAVDDAHWADEPSLRFLLHLAHRLAGLPVTLALAVRTGSERHREDLGPLMLEARPPVLRPRPLGEAAVASLVRARMGENASPQLCRACAEATGGNPFLLSELLGEFRRDARPVDTIDPQAVHRLAPERIAAAVLLRVSRLNPEAPALAHAAAVLGEQARLSLCARLAGLDGREAARLAASLVDLAVLAGGEPLRFVHPIVRTAIYNDLTAAEQADLHARAARLLAEERADPGAIALHLLATPPTGDRKVVAMLREAARSALAGGAPDTAALQLRRALDEPPDAADRPRSSSSSGTPNTRSAMLRRRVIFKRRGRPRRIRYFVHVPSWHSHGRRIPIRVGSASSCRSTSGRRGRSETTIESSHCNSTRRGWAR